MKNTLIFTILLSLFSSCIKEVERETIITDGSGTTTGGTTTGGTTTGGTTTGGTTTGGTGSSCLGTTADGDGQGSFPLMWREIKLAGNYSGGNPEWIPNYNDGTVICNYSALQAGLISYNDAQLLVNSVDTKLRARVKVLSQPTSCPFKQAGSESIPNYTKLRFTIKMFALVPIAGTSCFKMQATPYQYEPADPVNVDTCSQIFDIPYKALIQPAYTYPVVFAITNVRSDFECAYHGGDGNTIRCPAEKKVRNQSCYRMILQVATDATDDFQ